MDFEKDEYVNISDSKNSGAHYTDISKKSPDLSTKKTTKRIKKTPKAILVTRIISGVLSLILIVAGVAMVYAENKYINNFSNYEARTEYKGNPDKNNQNNVKPDNNEGNNEEDVYINRDNTNLLSHPNVLNIMLFGADQYGQGGLSDTMILMSIDSAHEKIKLTSFLRDTYVNIPYTCNHKLNYAYAVGGASLSIQTIEQNYGIKIDRYATVNFSTFRDIVDILGGVEVEVTYNEIGYINAQLWENGQSDHHLYAEPGLVRLDGYQALWYARNRGGTYGGVTYGGDDWDRTERQRKFISAIIEQTKNASISDIVDIVNAVGPNVTTDIKKAEITDLFLKHALTFLQYDVEQCSMPSDGRWGYGWNDAGSVILVNDWYGAREDLAKFIYEDLVR